MKRLSMISTVVLLLAISPGTLFAQTNRKTANTDPAERSLQSDPLSMGHPLSYWIKVIRDRDMDESEMAFDAIIELGPRAWKAVPDLAKLIEAPFTPIRIGVDSRRDMHEKLLDIHLRAGAIDSLGAIGEASGPATEAAIHWGLTHRVIATDPIAAKDRLFIELVGVDVLERMRVAGAVARFGIDAAPAVHDLITSPDHEKQKFAAAILNDEAVVIALELMQSETCKDRMVGLSLLSGMWPVVSKDHLAMLRETLSCTGVGKEREEPGAPAGKMFGSN